MQIPMVDLKAGYPLIKKEIELAIKTVLEKTNFILGEEVEKFEKEFASYCGVSYAIGVANGTDALKIALIASGIGKGDEVITTPFTFIATSEAIVQSGAKPVFVDIEPDTYTIDVNQIEKYITKNTKAILPVHLYGHPCEMEKILEISKRYNLIVIEDCAQSFSSWYKFNNGKTFVTGSMGIAGCFSFFPAKNLGCFGDGGMIITNNQDLYEKAKMLRNHGSKVKYFSKLHGFNSRLDTLQAAILSVKLKHIEYWTKKRNEIAAKYNEGLKDICKVPKIKENCRHSFNYYVIGVNGKSKRDNLQRFLTEKGIATHIYYPLSLHLQEVYTYLGYKNGDFPVAEKMQDETIALPMYPELSDDIIRYIIEQVKNGLK